MRALLLVLLLLRPALAAEPLRFWNLTNDTVTSLSLATPGTEQWGPNQCANDRDGEVDHNERLPLTGVTPGTYDVRLRAEGKYAFSLEPADLTDCR